ncbi:hypothetical protein [Treponema socranskii]|uniref:hypothetical protein n=1 Tax=Treponema TaxID=157 RepID=UPI00287125D7|nr:hypothetical protein [Treponema socranskii]MDR9859173.1 hypothetical protein [Treponema socranskii]
MAKISETTRGQLAEAIQPYQKQIDDLLTKEKTFIDLMKSDHAGEAYKKLQLAEDMVFVSSLYMAENSLSLKILEIKNNDALNESRKTLYRAIIYLEDIVTNFIDVPYSELSSKWENIANTPVAKRYLLIRKLGLAIRLLKDAFGENSKWKWSFVELEGRFAAVAKNLIDMKKGARDYFEPSSVDYETTVLYIRKLQKLLDASANGYRDKYELSTRRIDDMRNAIKFLLARHKLCLAIGDKTNAEDIKKKAVIWKDKMDADQKAGSSS